MRAVGSMTGSTLPRWRWLLAISAVVLTACTSANGANDPASELPPCDPTGPAPTSTPPGLPDDVPACDSGGHTTVTPQGPAKQPVSPSSAVATPSEAPPSKQPVAPDSTTSN